MSEHADLKQIKDWRSLSAVAKDYYPEYILGLETWLVWLKNFEGVSRPLMPQFFDEAHFDGFRKEVKERGGIAYLFYMWERGEPWRSQTVKRAANRLDIPFTGSAVLTKAKNPAIPDELLDHIDSVWVNEFRQTYYKLWLSFHLDDGEFEEA